MERRKLLSFDEAKQHLHFQLAINKAIQRAIDNPGEIYNVYYDGIAMFVRIKQATRPRFSIKVCDAQKEGDDVRVNYFNGKTELISETAT